MRKPALGELDLDWEANPANYEENGKQKNEKPRPLRQKIYAGMRLHLTRDVNKPLDVVNGMEATDPASGCLRVTTATGKDLALFPLTEDMEDGGCVTCYPARPGCASAIHKAQGANWLPSRSGWT